MYEDILIEWRRVMRSDDDKWQCWRCLYAYVDPNGREIIYLGKADRCTVRERWNGTDKDALREWAIEAGVERLHIHVGMIDWGTQKRYSAEKLTDIESLLIKRLQPRGNIMAKRTRIERPGIRVFCGGNWPHDRWEFRDI